MINGVSYGGVLPSSQMNFQAKYSGKFTKGIKTNTSISLRDLRKERIKEKDYVLKMRSTVEQLLVKISNREISLDEAFKQLKTIKKDIQEYLNMV